MAKLIFISPYLKGNRNSAQLANHVRYISTRDGVQTLNDGAKNLPPTKKQEEYMLHHMGNIFRDNVGTSGYRGLQLDRKRRKELQEWKIALGHREGDHEDPANYPTQSY